MRSLIRTSDMEVAMEKTQASYPVLRELANFIANGNRLPDIPIPCIRIVQSSVQDDAVTIEFDGSSGSFTCQLDGGISEPCTSPVTYTDLSTGLHVVNITGAGDADDCIKILDFNITCKLTIQFHGS